jgi:transcriptional regulator with XRE-family HTH domain
VVTYEATTAPAERRRAELGQFLRARRARLGPEDFGMPPGSRRRTPGLRREEVALLAGVGITWYTWLEQGREINASIQVLDAVARTLRLEPAERHHLYVLAEAVPVRVASTGCAAVPEAISEIVYSLDPLPAIVLNGRFDSLVSNDAYVELFRDWHLDPCVHKNGLWCCLTEPTARQKFPEYESEMRYMVARMRSVYAQYVGDPDWEEDIRRLSLLSPEFADLWSLHEVADPEPRTRTYLHPAVGPLTFTVSELAIPASTPARLIIYTPADDETRKLLPSTRD